MCILSGPSLLNCHRAHNGGCGGDCVARGLGPGWQKCYPNMLPACYRPLSLGAHRVRQGQGWVDCPNSWPFLWTRCLRPHLLACATQPKPRYHMGDEMQLPKCRHLMPFISLGVRTAKPSRTGLELLLQEGWVSCNSHGVFVNPV